MSKLLPAANSPHVEVREVISSVSFDTKPRGRRFFILFFFFLSCPSKTLWRFNSTVWRSSNFASDWKLQSAEQVAVSLRVEHKNIFSSPPSLPLCSAPLISRSLSLSHSIQHGKLQKDFSPPLLPPGSIIFKKRKRKNRDTQPAELTCYCKAFTFSQIQCAPQVSGSNASSPNVFSYDVLNPHAANLSAVLHCCSVPLFLCVCVDEPRLKHSALTPAVSCLWTNKALICPGFTGPGCPGLDQCITVIFPTGRSVWGSTLGPSAAQRACGDGEFPAGSGLGCTSSASVSGVWVSRLKCNS